MSKKQAFMP